LTSIEALDDDDAFTTCFTSALTNKVERAECKCRYDSLLANENQNRFTAPELLKYSFSLFDALAFPLDKISSDSANLFKNLISPDFDRNASLFFNAVETSSSTGAQYTPPKPNADVDAETLYSLSHIYDTKPINDVDSSVPFGYGDSLDQATAKLLVDKYIGRTRSNYVSRATGPHCYVYDINAIPEQVMHINVTMTPVGDPASAQTLQLSTINEPNGGLSTSGSSSSATTGQSGAFTARIENTQSATSSFGPSVVGSIVMCPDTPDGEPQASFINTIPGESPVDVTQNPWQRVVQANPGAAQSGVFNNRMIALLQGDELDNSNVGERSDRKSVV